MEDQQPAAGDLTEETRVDEARTDAAVESEAADTGQSEPEESGVEEAQDSAAGDETGDAAIEPAEDAEQTASEPTAEGAETVRTRRPVGRWLAAAVAIIAALFVGSAAFAGAMVQPYLVDRAVVATKLDVVRTAANAITTLWSYTPENLDKLADRAATYLAGDFEAQYRKFVDALVAPNKQAQVTNSTQVTGAAVESLEDQTAVAIVYTNSTATSPVTKNIPSLRYLSYRLFMKRDHARWLVTRMTTITSLDLTPRL